MSKYEAKFKCVFCGESDINDKQVDVVMNKQTLNMCPKCGKSSYCNSIRLKVAFDPKNWRIGVGSAKETQND